MFIGRTDAEAETPNTLATSCEVLTHWKRPYCWEGLGAGREGDDRGWDGWMASPTWRTWVWVNSRSWWWTGRPDVLRFMGSQRVGHNWATELNWTELTDHGYFTVLPSGLLPTRFSLILKSGILEAHFSVIFFYRQAIRAVKKAKLEKGSFLSTYSCIFGCRSLLLHEGFSNCTKWGLLSSCSTWAFHFGGSVSCRARAPGMWALQLWHMGLVAPRQVGSFQILDPTSVPGIARWILHP